MTEFTSDIEIEASQNEIVITLDGDSYIIDKDNAGMFLSAFYEAYKLIGGSEVLH
jgi:hypothetical protein